MKTGMASEAAKARWRGRAGAPSGPRSESAKLGIKPPRRRRGGQKLSAKVLAAFILADLAALRQALGLDVWENTPLHVFRRGCSYCGTPADAPAPTAAIAGCQNVHEVTALRGRIIAAIEKLGGFTWADLRHPDDEVARAAWWKLAPVSEAVGITDEQWTQLLRRAGWPEEGESDGRA